MQGKVALVTGAARGTGEAIARLFAAEGARVVVSDVLEAEGASVAASLGDAAIFQILDVRSEQAWSEAVAATLGAFGKLDVLVNNAAVLLIASIADTKREDLLRLVEVNQLGPFLGIRAVIEPMKANGGGSIVNVASSDGVKGMNGVVGYASTKWGLRGITKSAAMELAKHRIRVNAVCPEAGNPWMSAPFLPEGVDPTFAAELNANRLLEAPQGYTIEDRVRDVARAVLFFACDDCPTATAADLIVDGGLTAGYVQRGIPGGE